MLPTSMQTPSQLEPEGWWLWLPLNSSPTNQKNVHKLITLCLNHYYKTSHYPLQVRTHSFEGISLMASFAWQSTKATLFYFMQNCLCFWDLMRCWCPEDGSGITIGTCRPYEGQTWPSPAAQGWVPLSALCQPLTMFDSVILSWVPSPHHPGLCLISKSKDWGIDCEVGRMKVVGRRAEVGKRKQKEAHPLSMPVTSESQLLKTTTLGVLIMSSWICIFSILHYL